MQALSELKVLDFSTLLPGPFASMYLADWGAEVLRVEAPDREDMSRTMPPFADGTSTTHGYLNRSKLSLALDLKDPGARSRIAELIETYDIVIEQFRPGVMAKLGLDYASLAQVNPRLIYCSISGYGQTGPYRDRAGHDINYAALSGLAGMTGSKERGPALHGNPVCDLAGSMHALFGIMTAVYHRERTGEGQFIDVSITDSSLPMSGLWLQMMLAAKQSVGWESTILNGSSFYGYYKTSDGQYLSVGGLEPKFLMGFLEAIDGLAIMEMDFVRGGQDIKKAVAAKIERKTAEEWNEIFAKLDLCVEPVLTMDAIVKHPQFVAREMAVAVPAGPGKVQMQLASPLRFSTFRPVYRHIGAEKGSHDGQFAQKGRG